MFRLQRTSCLAVIAATSLVGWGQLGIAKTALSKADNESQARRTLASKLLRLGQSPDMKEASNRDSGDAGGGQNFNRNDGNSFSSDTTYHSNVWNYCMKWMGGRVCERWLDPYVALHGMTAERSPLEDVVARAWSATEKNIGKTVYKIWQVESNGPITDVDGKLDRSSLTRWELTPEVRQEVELVGTQTANRQMRLTYDEDAEERKGNTMPNMESLRTMASRWTKMYRNRLVANLGEIRAGQQPIEFMLGEDKYDCDQYLAELQRDPDPMDVDPRLRTQPLLDPMTRGAEIEQRYQLCVKMKQQSVYAVNPVAQGDDILPGDKESEAIDAWRIRANIATIDFAGIDPNSIPKPSNSPLTQEDITSEVVDYEVGGKEFQTLRMTNAQQLTSYNQALAEAAARSKAISVLSKNVPDNSEKISRWNINMQSMNLVELNGLTAEMKNELKDSEHPLAQDQPSTQFTQSEDRPSQLTVKALAN